MNKQENILFALFTLFFITLYFSTINVLNLLVTGGIVVYSLSLSSFSEKLTLFIKNRFVQAALFFFIVLIVSTLYSDNLEKGFHYLKLRVPLLLFPVSIGLLQLRKGFKDKVLQSFVYTTIGVCMACLIFGFYNYFANQQLDALYNDNFTSLLKQQSVYIALLINFAIYTIGYLLVQKHTAKPFLLISGGLFLFVVAYLLGSRINLGLLAAVSLGFGFYYLVSRKKYLETATLCLAISMGSMIIYKAKPQMLNRFKELAYSKYEYTNTGAESHYGVELTEDQWNGANFRLAAWNCGWELFKENPITGVGLGDKKDALFAKYEQKEFRFAIDTNKNVHNNYLDVLYGLGIFGFIVFILSWVILPFVQAFKQENWLAMIFIFSLACAWITEIYFDRSLGGMVAGFFIPFMLISQKEG